MSKADRVRLQHMLDSARESIALSQGRSRADLDKSRMLTLALVKSMEIVGEAASKVSSDTRAGTPAIPWADIVGMRNRLIHAYFDIDLDRVWDTVTDDIPPLIAELERVLASIEGDISSEV